MNHLGLFEGIGGFSLAARWMDWETKGWVEINPFCQKVLKHHFPEAQGFSDIKKFSYAVYKSILRNRGIKDRSIDIITGGFPCQPYSSAGLRKGTDDPRHLWPYMLETIRQFKPTWVVGENVRGITNWNGGLVFEQVQTELEAIGYEVQAFVLPACSVGAPHRRDRVWFVAYCPDTRAESVRRKRKNSVVNLGLLPTPCLHNENGRSEGWSPSLLQAVTALIPTPTARDYRSGFDPNGQAFKDRLNHPRGVNLAEYMQRVENGFLPTPTASKGFKATANQNQDNLQKRFQTGGNSQLNPRFVGEMMGFPPDWLELPFQDTDASQSKHMETP